MCLPSSRGELTPSPAHRKAACSENTAACTTGVHASPTLDPLLWGPTGAATPALECHFHTFPVKI